MQSSIDQKGWRRYMAVFICFFVQQVAFAMEPYVPKRIDPFSEPWRWRAISELDDKGVNCLAEDADGSMWFGVNRGVLRYDGLTWKAYDAENGFTSEAIRFLCTATDGSIYASTGSDVWHFVEGAWEKSTLLVRVLRLDRAVEEGLWLGTPYGAIHLIGNQPTLYTTQAAFPKKMPPGFPPSTRIEWLPEGLIEGTTCAVGGVLEEPDGTVWFAVNTREIIRFNRQTADGEADRFRPFLTEQKGLRLRGKIYFSRDSQGVVRVASPAGIYRYRAGAEEWERLDLMGRVDFLGQHVAILSGRGGGWMVALSDTIYSFSLLQETAFPYPSMEQSFPLLLESMNGSLWVGKQQGKMFLVDRSETRWDSFVDLNFQCNDGAGQQWFLTQSGRAVCRAEDDWLQYSEADGLMDTPLTLLSDHDGQLWAAGSHRHTAATAYFDGIGWIRELHPGLSESIDENAALILRDGAVLFGARRPRNRAMTGGGLRTQKGLDGAVQYETLMNPVIPDAMAEQANGRLWFCEGPLFYMEGGIRNAVNEPPELGTRGVTKLAVDAQDQLWAAQWDSGIFRLAGTNWSHYTAEDGLGGNRVADLLCTADQSVWCATAGGISRFDGQSWAANVLGESVPGFPLVGGSLRASDDGSIWINLAERNWFYREQFPLIELENYIYPFKTVRYRPDSQPPETEWLVTAERVSPPGNVYFEWQGTSLWEATPRSELTYSWRLNGDGWSDFTPKPSHLFLALRPGTYRLEVRSRDMNFNVDPSPAQLAFTVLAPVWQQPWFILMISLFSSGLAALAYFLIRSRNQHQLAKQRHLTEIEQIKLQFFTSISHELRTPLTVMLGPLQSIYEKINQPEIKDRLRMVMRNGQKLRTLVDQILDFRKLDAGKMPIEWARGDLIQYTQSIFESMEAYGVLEDVQCAFEVPRARCLVWCDPDKLQKIFGNLLSNAIKYTPAGGHVTANLRIQYDQNGAPEQAVFCVEDSGEGISLEAQPHIFEHYYRGDSCSQGTGLGLALVKELIDLLEGSITLTSPISEERGTRFVVQLPLREHAPEGVTDQQQIMPLEVRDDLLAEVSALETDSPRADGCPTLLVIDDQPDIRTFIRSELEGSYLILEAEDGRAGLEMAAQAMPDLVIADVMMPIMDGIEFCRLLKTNDITSHIPVIMLTARTSQQHELEGLENGADDYVTKPFSMDVLKARIHTQLESRRIMREHFSQQIKLGDLELPSSSVDRLFQERVLKIIHEHMGDDTFNVDQFAQAMNMGKRTLQNKIKAVMDQTPSELIRTLRLNQAKQWLEQPNQDRTIAEIAAAVGYLDQSHFGKAFKKQFGETPSAVLARTHFEEN